MCATHSALRPPHWNPLTRPGMPSPCSMPSLAERLYHAARDGDLPGLHAWLAAGADPNERRGHGRETTFDTALHAAALYGHAACVRALLAPGADPQ